VIGFSPDHLTRDAFLGGRIELLQPRSGYRAGVDPVLLAAAVPVRAGQSVLELGCGAGAASLCLAARVAGVDVTGIELQPEYADLARQNAAHNKIAMQVFTADLTALPDTLRHIGFDHIIANPPYFKRGAHSPSPDGGRRVALGEDTPLSDWIGTAAKRLAAKGYLHVIQRADRLPDLLAACAGRLGSLEILPLAARIGRAPDLIILRARKSGRAAFVLHAPVILHEGAEHRADGDSYRDEITGILRDGAPLVWPSRR
jgi:tRNA1(Val) A37 N6-methylase TrmN6